MGTVSNSVGDRLRPVSDTVSDRSAELDRRYANVREAMAAAELDGLVVAGSEY